MNKIAIYGSRRQPNAILHLPELFKFLNDSGFRVFVFDKFAEYLEENNVDMHQSVPVEHIPPEVSLVMSLGGDGTFLRSARYPRRFRAQAAGSECEKSSLPSTLIPSDCIHPHSLWYRSRRQRPPHPPSG